MLLNTGPEVVQSRHGLLSTLAFQLGPSAPPCYALEGSIAIAGQGISWLRDRMGFIASAGTRLRRGLRHLALLLLPLLPLLLLCLAAGESLCTLQPPCTAATRCGAAPAHIPSAYLSAHALTACVTACVATADSEAVAGSVPDTGGVYFVPAFGGLLAPWWQDDARGVIVGLTQYSTKVYCCRRRRRRRHSQPGIPASVPSPPAHA